MLVSQSCPALCNPMDCSSPGPSVHGIPQARKGKAGNPFHTKKGNRLSCRDQEGRRGSEEAVPGPSVFPSGEPGVSARSLLLPGREG